MSDIIETINTIKQQDESQGRDSIFSILEDELATALNMYREKAGNILEGSGVKPPDFPSGYLSLENNFFSVLFLYSYYRADIPGSRRILYAAINQCLREIVTGFNNLLNDKYKKILETDLTESGERFRSVLDIMASDRVLFDILLNGFSDNDKILEAGIMSLRALIKSGIEEAPEEGGINDILPPDQVLDSIHHNKTVALFKCPWVVPSIMEKIDESQSELLNNALYNIGMGCQIMGDMVDFAGDVRAKHNNYIVSLIYYDDSPYDWQFLESLLISEEIEEEHKDLLMAFPRARSTAVDTASSFLIKGLNDLFEEDYQIMVEPAFRFLASKIGADKYFTA